MTNVFGELVQASWRYFDEAVEVMVVALLMTKCGGRSSNNLPIVKFQEFAGINSVLFFLGVVRHIQVEIWYI